MPSFPATPPNPPYPRFLPLGDTALSVEFGDSISPELNAKVLALDAALAAAALDGIQETILSYRSLLVLYDPREMPYARLITALRGLASRPEQTEPPGRRHWTVPVVYDPPYGVDVPDVARRLDLAEEEVISLHVGADYRVYMVGFAPGMPYLGGLPERLHISRRDAPRPFVPEGSVLIGGMQTGIYPQRFPSGWHILGQTPLRPFDVERADPFMFRAGDRINFRRISVAEFDYLSGLPSEDMQPLARINS